MKGESRRLARVRWSIISSNTIRHATPGYVVAVGRVRYLPTS